MLNHCLRRLVNVVALILVLAIPASAQLTSQGNEQVITYSGATAFILSNTPVNPNLLVSTGTNTFIMNVNPPANSARVYITNDTANACTSLSVSMASSGNTSLNSFNNSPQAWQSVGLQSANNGANNTQVINLPANATVAITSQPIIASKIALFVILPFSTCGGTNIDVQVVFGPFGQFSNLGSGNITQVQGPVLPPGSYSSNNPVISGGVTQSTNSQFLLGGLDIFNNSQAIITGNGLFLGASTPTPTQGPNEIALSFSTTTGATTGLFVNAPWKCPQGPGGQACAAGGGSINLAAYSPAVAGVPLQFNYTGATGFPQNLLSTTLLFKQGTLEGSSGSVGGNGSGPPGTAAGSQIIFGVLCNTPCGFTSTTSLLGNTYQIVSTNTLVNANSSQEVIILTHTNKNPGGNETLTLNGVSGTLAGLIWATIDGPANSVPNEPTVVNEADPTGAEVIRLDAQFPNQFVCNVTITANTTLQCQAAPTTLNGVAVRAYVTDIQVETTTAGTATVIQLVTGGGTNCGTAVANLSAITYPNTTVGTVTYSGFRTGLFDQLTTQTDRAVCIKQSGTTAGTSVVELHGYLAP